MTRLIKSAAIPLLAALFLVIGPSMLEGLTHTAVDLLLAAKFTLGY